VVIVGANVSNPRRCSSSRREVARAITVCLDLARDLVMRSSVIALILAAGTPACLFGGSGSDDDSSDDGIEVPEPPDPEPDPPCDDFLECPSIPDSLTFEGLEYGTALGGTHVVRVMEPAFLGGLTEFDVPFTVTATGGAAVESVAPPRITLRGDAVGPGEIVLRRVEDGAEFGRSPTSVQAIASADVPGIWSTHAQQRVEIALYADDDTRLMDTSMAIDASAIGGTTIEPGTVDVGPLAAGNYDVTIVPGDGVDRVVTLRTADRPQSITLLDAFYVFDEPIVGNQIEIDRLAAWRFEARRGGELFRGAEWTIIPPPGVPEGNVLVLPVYPDEALIGFQATTPGTYTIRVFANDVAYDLVIEAVAP
jgi:hypothetical protein